MQIPLPSGSFRNHELSHLPAPVFFSEGPVEVQVVAWVEEPTKCETPDDRMPLHSRRRFMTILSRRRAL
jgi:hypothetical protein